MSNEMPVFDRRSATDAVLGTEACNDSISVRTEYLDALVQQDLTAWETLSANSARSSIFAEPFFVASVLQHFHKGSHTKLFIVERSDGVWLGVIALSQEAKFGRVQAMHWKTVVNANQFLGIPLVHAGYETVFWQHLLVALDNSDTACFALSCGYMPCDDPVTEALIAVSKTQSRRIELMRTWERAILKPKGDFGCFLSHKKRARIQSLWRKLSDDHSAPIFTTFDGTQYIDSWIEDFLTLEQSGWKGRQRSAMGCNPNSKALFCDTIRASAISGQLRFVALHVNGKPIAMSALFISGEFGFGFKSAYDQAFAAYAPGVLLLHEVSRTLHGISGLYFDSCSAPDQKPLNDFWRDRRQIADLCIALHSPRQRTVFNIIIQVRRLWQMLKRVAVRH